LAIHLLAGLITFQHDRLVLAGFLAAMVFDRFAAVAKRR
jgi:hypothetical protein